MSLNSIDVHMKVYLPDQISTASKLEKINQCDFLKQPGKCCPSISAHKGTLNIYPAHPF